MERNYSVGLGTNNISLQVKVGSLATCYTKAILKLSGGQKIPKGESPQNTNGNVDKTGIGLASNLLSNELTVSTIADFGALPPEQIQSILGDAHTLKVNLKVEYVFDGGFSGIQIFDYDYDDFTIIGSTQVIITKEIDFVQ